MVDKPKMLEAYLEANTSALETRLLPSLIEDLGLGCKTTFKSSKAIDWNPKIATEATQESQGGDRPQTQTIKTILMESYARSLNTNLN